MCGVLWFCLFACFRAKDFLLTGQNERVIILPNSFAALEKYLACVKKCLANSSAISLIWSREIRQEGVAHLCIADVDFHIPRKTVQISKTEFQNYKF